MHKNMFHPQVGNLFLQYRFSIIIFTFAMRPEIEKHEIAISISMSENNFQLFSQKNMLKRIEE